MRISTVWLLVVGAVVCLATPVAAVPIDEDDVDILDRTYECGGDLVEQAVYLYEGEVLGCQVRFDDGATVIYTSDCNESGDEHPAHVKLGLTFDKEGLMLTARDYVCSLI